MVLLEILGHMVFALLPKNTLCLVEHFVEEHFVAECLHFFLLLAFQSSRFLHYNGSDQTDFDFIYALFYFVALVVCV